MPTKKTPTKSAPRAKSTKPTAQAGGGRLENLASRPSYDDILDEQLVDHSGVFRVTSQISQAQTGHDEEATRRFASDSLVIAAQRDGFPDDGPTLDESVEEHAVEDEALRAIKQQRIATLAARAQQTRSRPRR